MKLKDKRVTLEQAIALIKDGDTVATSGFGLDCLADELFKGVEDSFLQKGTPKNLTCVHCAGQTDFESAGYQRWAHEGLISKLISGHMGSNPGIVKLIVDEKIQCWNLPQGVIAHMYRSRAQGKPGEITKIGLRTFCDPRFGGGRLNESTKEDIVKVVEVDGEEYLFYPTPNLNIGLIRGTTADEYGNISVEEEAHMADILELAMCVKACGGKVIAQVKNYVKAGSIDTQMVKVPGVFVDAIYISQEPEKYHRQTKLVMYSSVFAGHTKVPEGSITPLELDDKKVIARRAALELVPYSSVNLGLGIPMNVATVAAEEGIGEHIVSSVEVGIIGGTPAGGVNFGAATNAWAWLNEPAQFDYYNGGGLDLTCLGFAEVDPKGNVNVSRFGPKIAGVGGFIDISQATKNVIFTGTMTAGGLKTEVKDGKLTILQEGRNKKFVKSVEQVTFSADFANETNQNVLFVTERCVFKVTPEGLKLIEIAPGIDLQKDVLDQMEFTPIVAEDLKIMDPKLFSEGLIGLKEHVLAKAK